MVSTDTTPGVESSPAGNAARRAAPELALVAWTLFSWGGRIRNVLADESLEGSGRLWRLGLAGGLTALALALLVALMLRPVTARPVRSLAATLAGVSSAVWIVRGIDIALGSHPPGFKVVHTVLAVVTVALSLLVARHLRSLSR